MLKKTKNDVRTHRRTLINLDMILSSIILEKYKIAFFAFYQYINRFQRDLHIKIISILNSLKRFV